MLDKLLEKKKISLYKLAKETGIPYATLSDMKNGKVTADHISAGNLYKMSSYLEMTMDELYECLNKKDVLYLKSQKDFPVSSRLRNKVQKIRIPIPEYKTEGRFILKEDKYMLSFTYMNKGYEIPFDGIVSNERYHILESMGAFLINNFLKHESFNSFAKGVMGNAGNQLYPET